MQQTEKPKRDKLMLTFFILLVPSLLIAMTASVESFTIRIAFQIVLIVLQGVLVKNLLGDYYGET